MYYTIVLIGTPLAFAAIIFSKGDEKQKWAGFTILAIFVFMCFGACYDLGHHQGEFAGNKKIEQAAEDQERLISSTRDQTIRSIAYILPPEGGKSYKVLGEVMNSDLFIVTADKESEARVYRIPDDLRWQTLKVGTTVTYSPHNRSWSIGSF